MKADTALPKKEDDIFKIEYYNRSIDTYLVMHVVPVEWDSEHELASYFAKCFAKQFGVLPTEFLEKQDPGTQ